MIFKNAKIYYLQNFLFFCRGGVAGMEHDNNTFALNLVCPSALPFNTGMPYLHVVTCMWRSKLTFLPVCVGLCRAVWHRISWKLHVLFLRLSKRLHCEHNALIIYF